MKAYLADLIRAAPTPAHGRNAAREYLQARILGALQRARDGGAGAGSGGISGEPNPMQN